MSAQPVHTVMPYGAAIQQAISEGSLSQMKQLHQQSEQYLNDLRAQLKELENEISRLERR
ncbi:DUF1843 domain-containing protein [Chromobacterium subtsugae]|uniref:DUF1843 domain-containing protein n=1 Tax=Chromobacterium subtsugae TaxID=251747 RepID=A0ABS7FEQ0_9NEIS|nr:MULTISPECIES: DUF1843 domain-containing protein [Chromobacterium]MBW7565758.1 DUF1843 domain-containing protein [Chromobacterium subtsugae]MBW8288537.1 DUF1843 domain-containing protein [Chromobacterium subtsugae]OBU86794.1 hypothetical protein MY55_08205 [Chromobacterium subtsugae]WSE89852.1 DUF1843 domain-containing protein [Chromobacterium subtsugae]WVH58223.1 DUF1843 domain-containing protein [Chromobacterium subtsugae]